MQAKDLIQIFEQMKDIKAGYIPLMQDAFNLVNPRRYDMTGLMIKGRKRGEAMVDSKPNLYLETCVSGVQGLMFNENDRWFKSVFNSRELRRNDDVLYWMQEYDEQMYSEYQRSNFYDIGSEFLRDGYSGGTAANAVDDDIETQSAVIALLHPRETYLSEDCYGRVNRVFRLFVMTAEQIDRKFRGTGDVIPDCVKRDIEQNRPQTEYEILHCFYKNTDRDTTKKDSKNKEWASKTIFYGIKGGQNYTMSNVPIVTQTFLRESGYDYRALNAWRCRKNSDEIYGYSPAMDGMCAVQGVNQLTASIYRATHLVVDGPTNVPYEMQGREELLPGGVNYFKSPNMMPHRMIQNINLPWAKEQKDDLDDTLAQRYSVDLFRMLQNMTREITIPELDARLGEKIILLAQSSLITQLKLEGLIPIHEAISEIALRYKRLPQAPPVVIDYIWKKWKENRVAGQPEINPEELVKINVVFTGKMAQMQRNIFELKNLRQTVQDAAQLQVVAPIVQHKFRWFQMAERIAEANQCPQDLIVPDDEAQAVVDAINAAQAKKEQTMMMMEAGKTAGKLNKAIEPNSVLDNLGKVSGAKGAA
jgi:hypothetical protein